MVFLTPHPPDAAPHYRMPGISRMLVLVVLCLVSTMLRAEPLALDYLCQRDNLFDRGGPPTDGWRHAADGKVLLPEGAGACWVRSDAPIPAGQTLAFAASYADVQVFDARGRLLAAGLHTGQRSNALLTSRHLFFPNMDTGWRYARLAFFSSLNRSETVAAERVDLTAAYQADQEFDHTNLAILVGLIAIAVFCALFGIALRDRDYALLVAWLCCCAAYKWGYGGFSYAMSNAPYASFYAVFPMVVLANVTRQLVVARVGKFHEHSPMLNRLSWITVWLLLLLIPTFYWCPDFMATANAWLLLLASFPLLLAGTWRGWRAGDQLCAGLFIGNLPLTVYYAPQLLAGITGNPSFASVSVHGSWLNYAADLLLPILFCAGLAARSRSLRNEAIHLATHDALTGLPNRELMLQSGEKQLATEIALAVLVLNIERFKAINATLGPQIGDRLLVETAARLAQLAGGQLSRLHADQFCLLVADGSRLDALRDQIGQAFAVPIEVNGQTVDLALAVGVARAGLGAPGAAPGMAQLLRNAEMALDHARAHRQGWAEYSGALESLQRADLGLLSELGRAVEQDELRMFLQPKVRLADGAVISAEALIRWHHPDRGLVPPGEFVPFAEQTGRICLLTRWILRQAMMQTVQWRRAGRPLQISVNLSSCDLDEAGFPERLAAMLAETGADPADILLEITESGAMTDPGAALAVMAALRAIGLTLSIDDFGTGYSSLIYLQKMPVSELKIDRAFVHGITASGEGLALLKSIIELGHQLGLSVVAEGAETADEWRLLGELGCDFVQGWFAAMPMPVDAFEQWCAQRTPFLLEPPSRLGAPQACSASDPVKLVDPALDGIK